MATMRVSDVTPGHVQEATQHLLDTVAALSNEAVLAPSLCTGWSRGHVISHLARNADGLVRVVRSGLDDTGETMYDSPEKRDSDIEAGARRAARDHLADLRDTASELHIQLSRLAPEHAEVRVPRTPSGMDIPLRRVPFMRLREVILHHVDLDAGFRLASVDADVLALLLDQQVRMLRANPDAPGLTLRTTEGDDHVVADGSTTVSGSRAAVLLWLTRAETRGVSFEGEVPTLPFGG